MRTHLNLEVLEALSTTDILPLMVINWYSSLDFSLYFNFRYIIILIK